MDYIKEEITQSYYEDANFSFLKRNVPMVINITGEDYAGFVKRFQKPYDPLFIASMQRTLSYLCEQVPGCVFGYNHGFEFVLVIAPPSNIEQSSWFSYDLQKISSLTASMAGLHFNKDFEKSAKNYVLAGNNFDQTKKLNAMQGYVHAIDKGAIFSACCFNLPVEELHKYLYLKQKASLDRAIKEMGQTYFEEAELAGKSPSDIQFMVFNKCGINFDNYPIPFKRGSACLKNRMENGFLLCETAPEGNWFIDKEMPLMREENRNYIDCLFPSKTF